MAIGLLVACSDKPTEIELGPMTALIVVSGDQQSGVVGKELPNQLVVRAQNAAGPPIPNQLVNFVVTSGGGSVFAGSAITNLVGQAREHWTLGTSTSFAQSVEVQAVDPTTGEKQSFARFTATPTADVPTSVTKVKGGGEVVEPAQPTADSLSVIVRDQYSNPVPGATATWAVTAGGGSVSPSANATSAAGIAQTQFTTGMTGTQTASATVASLQYVDPRLRAGACEATVIMTVAAVAARFFVHS